MQGSNNSLASPCSPDALPLMNSRGSPTQTTRANLAITTEGITIGTLKAIDTSKAIGQGITIREIPDIINPAS